MTWTPEQEREWGALGQAEHQAEVSVEDAAEFSAHLRMGRLREALAAAPRPCHFRRCLLTMWHEGAHEVDREVEG